MNEERVVRTLRAARGETALRLGGCAIAGVCLVLLCLDGCGSSASKLYRAFPEQKRHFESVAIMMDYIMIEGLMEDTSKVDLIENRRVGNALLTVCADSLSQKEYPVRKTILSSVGLLMKPDKGYRVVRTTQAQHDDAEQLPIGNPPFFVDDQFLPDTILEHLMNVYVSLINIPEKRESVSVVVPEAAFIGRQLDCSTIVVLLVGGFNVPVSREMGKAPLNQSKTMGIVTVKGVSQLSMMLYVIDAKNGQIIWGDRRFFSGGIIFPEKILRIAGDLLGDLP